MKTTNLKTYILFLFVLIIFSCENKNEDVLNGIFSDGELAEVMISSIDSISDTEAKLTYILTSAGKGRILERGICWSTLNTSPTLEDSHFSINNADTVQFRMSKLTPETIYFVRPYMVNTKGTGYGETVSFTTKTLPTLNTSSITDITATTAIAGGTITKDGGDSITVRGVCWSTTNNPSIALSTKTTDGKSKGTFISSLTNLVVGTTYYVRAYATNSIGTAYGNEITFNNNLPTVATNPITDITSITANAGGNVSNQGGSVVLSRGICWSTAPNPTIDLITKTTDGIGLGTFTSTLVNLQNGVIYYVRAYATNSIGTSYGVQQSFTTNSYATVTANTITNITSSTANTGGYIINDGGSSVIARGVCWSTSTDPTINLSTKTTDGSGVGNFSSNIAGLQPGKTYYVRAYATNTLGTAYSANATFKTVSVIPTVSTTTITSITSSTANAGGNITSDGGATITARGVCWSPSTNPTISNNKTTDGSGTGAFASSISGLTAGITYYVRAYATNSVGTSYGLQQSFTSTAISIVLPTLSTTTVNSIAPTTAVSGGNITSDGGGTIFARGVCWSTSSNPTLSNANTSDGGGTGSFTSSMTGLMAGMNYYVRAYATNSAGTAYGTQVSFTTNTIITACGAYIAPGVWKEFKCHNLGANTSLDPMTYSEGINGDLYQWGRPTDGHEKRTSATTTTLATSNTPGHSSFIIGNNDWRSTGGEDSHWSEVTKGVNDPCPAGFKVPSKVQWEDVVTNNTKGAWENGYKFGDKLFLPASGERGFSVGTLSIVGSYGYYWSSSALSVTHAFTLLIDGYNSILVGHHRAEGMSIRCIKEDAVVGSIPTLSTNTISNIASTTATSGGIITSDGGASVTARGVCWSSSTSQPTISNSKTSDGSGLGSFTSSITGLTAGTTYYVRAYATNSAGTAYGMQRSFTTTTSLSGKTPGTLTIKTTVTYSSPYFYVVWIKNSAGAFLRTLTMYGNTSNYFSDLVNWYSESSLNKVNATTGATKSSAGIQTATWNAQNQANSAVVDDGVYTVSIEMTSESYATNSKYITTTFTKGPVAQTVNPANLSPMSTVSVQWMPQ